MRPEASKLLQVILMFLAFCLFEHIVGSGIFFFLIHIFY
jgi:hypothetical protein